MNTRPIKERIRLAPEVSTALVNHGPVVALESTLISHGLPYPQNVEVARASEAAVRGQGAVPATVAIHHGFFLVGLGPRELEDLATNGDVMKAARPSLARAFVRPGWSATTVSATMIAAHAAGIDVFATGGIGGVHRGALGGSSPSFDISADLEELARTPVAVVCAGPKAILDVAATMEYLETRGVPVLVVGGDEVPGFYSQGSGVPAPATVPDMAAAADVVAAHLGSGLGSGILVCVPIPVADALDRAEIGAAIDRAHREAAEAAVAGPALTPWILARLATSSRAARACGRTRR